MFYVIDATDRRRAKAAHELTMLNLIGVNLLLGIALLAGAMAEPDTLLARLHWPAVVLLLAVSLAIMGLTWRRAARLAATGPWFAAAHWRLAARRYRVLLVAYLVAGALVGLGAFGGGGNRAELERRIADLPPALQQMERDKLASQHMGGAIWGRIGVVPLLLAVMALIMLASGAIWQVGRGEVPDALLAALPPPDGLAGSRDPPATEA